MIQSYYVNLDDLIGTLCVLESDGTPVRYEIDLDGGRADAVVEQFIFAPGVDHFLVSEAIEHRSALLTLDQLCARAPHDVDWARAPHVVWAARGMWGIPLEFGLKPETVEVVGETVAL